MGCDIHTMVEVNTNSQENGEPSSWGWHNAGELSEDRNYSLFGILADVRGDGPAIADKRGIPAEDECSSEYAAWVKDYGTDGHSHSWLTLKELQDFYLDSPPESKNALAGLETYIREMEDIMMKYEVAPTHVRMCFYFDN